MHDYRSDALAGINRHLEGSLIRERGKGGQKQSGTPRKLSEELAEKPITVTFGMGEDVRDFQLYPKPHLEADEWRTAALIMINQAKPILMQELDIDDPAALMKSGEAIMNLVNVFVSATVPAMAELVFDWEPTLDRDLILRKLGATDAQLGTAFLGCLQLAFPFASTLQGVTRLIQGSQVKATEAPKQEMAAAT